MVVVTRAAEWAAASKQIKIPAAGYWLKTFIDITFLKITQYGGSEIFFF